MPQRWNAWAITLLSAGMGAGVALAVARWLNSSTTKSATEDGHAMTDKTVRDVMSTPVITVTPDTPYKQIVETLEEHRIGAVPVLRAREVVGIVSEADLLTKVALEGDPAKVIEMPAHRRARRRAAGDHANNLMSTPAITIASGESVVSAARLMDRHRIKHLPVVDEDGLVGIVSRVDLLRVFLRTDEAIRKDVTAKVLDRILLVEPGTVGVDVRDGVVTLSGQLDFKGMIPIAVRLTHSVDGVVDVVSHLSYAMDDTPPGGIARLGRGGKLHA